MFISIRDKSCSFIEELKQFDKEGKMPKTFNMKDFATSVQFPLHSQQISQFSNDRGCYCKNFNTARHLSCFKCGIKVHRCIATSPNRPGKLYECCSCISKDMDPVFKVKKVLMEGYYEIKSIFKNSNEITFSFEVDEQDLKYAVELRGFRSIHREFSTKISWPMQGEFLIQKQLVYRFTPLLSNTNRKARRETYVQIKSRFLRPGINQLVFRIDKLRKSDMQPHWKFDEEGFYYLSVNLVEKQTAEQIVEQTMQKRRLEKPECLKLLARDTDDVHMTETKLNLICPYTLSPIIIPVRGKYCSHFNCVCLMTLMLHKDLRLWNCPLCDERINQPYVDMLMYGILKSQPTGSKVMINSDGSYKWEDGDQKAVQMEEDKNSPQLLDQNQTDSAVMVDDRLDNGPITKEEEIIKIEDDAIEISDEARVISDEEPMAMPYVPSDWMQVSTIVRSRIEMSPPREVALPVEVPLAAPVEDPQPPVPVNFQPQQAVLEPVAPILEPVTLQTSLPEPRVPHVQQLPEAEPALPLSASEVEVDQKKLAEGVMEKIKAFVNKRKPTKQEEKSNQEKQQLEERLPPQNIHRNSVQETKSTSIIFDVEEKTARVMRPQKFRSNHYFRRIRCPEAMVDKLLSHPGVKNLFKLIL